MIGPLNITPDALLHETLLMQQKLAAGLRTLPEVEDVHYGATGKQEVWRDGKVALYRFVPPLDTAFVLAIRHQREAGFSHP